MGGNSYRPLLGKWCELLKPKRILEWGPGESTELMMKLCPDAEIISIEHNKVWFEKWKHLGCVNLKEAPESDRNNPLWERYCWPEGLDIDNKGKFDLIFVDGRERVRCLKNSKAFISKDGVVILHDSERNEYKPGIELYDKVEEQFDTVVLRLKK
jgi:predicted O-methyltransferase YrrM